MTATYSGTTAGATSANPHVVLTSVMGGNIVNAPGVVGGRVWLYQSTNASTDMMAANSFSDAYQLGMQAGDIVLGVYSTAAGSSQAIAYLAVVGKTSTSGAALSTFAVTSTAQ